MWNYNRNFGEIYLSVSICVEIGIYKEREKYLIGEW